MAVWFVVYQGCVYWGTLHCLGVQKERLYAKTSLRSVKQRERRSHELETEMHRDSSANETVSLLLAHTGNPKWHAAAIGLPKGLAVIQF